jgi:hypothetical protein
VLTWRTKVRSYDFVTDEKPKKKREKKKTREGMQGGIVGSQ